MTLRPASALATALGLLGLLATSCSKGGGSGGGLVLNSCSLGCTSAAPDAPFTCGITNVAVNQEIRLTFSAEINLDTVDNSTFRVEDSSGKTPPSTFLLDPNNSRVLIYRPLLTFDSSGNPSFGLTADETYTITIPGSNLDSEPFIESMDGQANTTRLRCTVVASEGIFDPKPGPPRATVTVTVVDPITGQMQAGVNAQNAFDVYRNSPIRLEFNDLMNPSTLVDPVTGTSSTMSVAVDPDGDTSDAGDQVVVDGRFSIVVNQFALTTSVVFTPSGSYPSRGSDVISPRKIVLRLPLSIVDLGGNSLTNAGTFGFTPEKISFLPLEIVEDFDDNTFEDRTRTSTTTQWNTGGNGGLLKAPGGGSGRLGDLVLGIGQLVVLSTDSEDFSSIDDPETFDPTTVVDTAFDPMTGGIADPVVGGVFEFANLVLNPGSTLLFEGANPPRILVRGTALIQSGSLISAVGATAPLHDSTVVEGATGAPAMLGGGAGGAGGQMPDGTGFPDGVPNPGVVVFDDLNGQEGGGIPVPDALGPLDFVAGGTGGLAFPQPQGGIATLGIPVDQTDIGTGLDPVVQFDRRAAAPVGTECRNPMPAGSGAGGAYAVPGLGGLADHAPIGEICTGGCTCGTIRAAPGPPAPFECPADTPGASDAGLNLGAAERTLDPEAGYLRGGTGGGGGGAHIQGTKTGGNFFDCHEQGGNPLEITSYSQHSGAGGGAGGGAVQVQGGRSLHVGGALDASGGNGGGADPADGFASPGGGGSGGAVLLQAPEMTFSNLARRIDVTGGIGGTGINGGVGGVGAPGLVRLETFQPLLDFAILSERVGPSPAALLATYNEMDFTKILSIGEFAPAPVGPGGRSGAQSCWIRPEGNFFLIEFQDDDPGGELGWDMLLRVTVPGVNPVQSFRGDNQLFPVSIEEMLGNAVGESPLVVRFQGARLVTPLENPCSVTIQGAASQILPGSLTPWVRHPALLNNPDQGLTPNMFRFQIIWDASRPGYSQMQGIVQLSLRTLPD